MSDVLRSQLLWFGQIENCLWSARPKKLHGFRCVWKCRSCCLSTPWPSCYWFFLFYFFFGIIFNASLHICRTQLNALHGNKSDRYTCGCRHTCPETWCTLVSSCIFPQEFNSPHEVLPLTHSAPYAGHCLNQPWHSLWHKNHKLSHIHTPCRHPNTCLNPKYTQQPTHSHAPQTAAAALCGHSADTDNPNQPTSGHWTTWSFAAMSCRK